MKSAKQQKRKGKWRNPKSTAEGVNRASMGKKEGMPGREREKKEPKIEEKVYQTKELRRGCTRRGGKEGKRTSVIHSLGIFTRYYLSGRSSGEGKCAEGRAGGQSKRTSVTWCRQTRKKRRDGGPNCQILRGESLRRKEPTKRKRRYTELRKPFDCRSKRRGREKCPGLVFRDCLVARKHDGRKSRVGQGKKANETCSGHEREKGRKGEGVAEIRQWFALDRPGEGGSQGRRESKAWRLKRHKGGRGKPRYSQRRFKWG